MGTVQGYVLDVAQAANIDASTAPFDYVYAAGLWSLAFTFVLSLYFVSKSTGTILNFIRGTVADQAPIIPISAQL